MGTGASVSRTTNAAGAPGAGVVEVATGPLGAGVDLALVAPTTAGALLAQQRSLPVAEHLQSLLPAGQLQRGSTVGVEGSAGSVTLAFALVAEAARQGSWVAVLGAESLGLSAVQECGVPFERLVLVDSRPNISAETWADVAATLVDGFDLVVVLAGANQPRIGYRSSRRLTARARERGSIIMAVGRRWEVAPDVQFSLTDSAWTGLGQGHGHLQGRQTTVVVGGRREAARERRFVVWLPDPVGLCRVESAHAAKYAGSDIDQLVKAGEGQAGAAEAGTRAHLRVV